MLCIFVCLCNALNLLLFHLCLHSVYWFLQLLLFLPGKYNHVLPRQYRVQVMIRCRYLWQYCFPGEGSNTVYTSTHNCASPSLGFVLKYSAWNCSSDPVMFCLAVIMRWLDDIVQLASTEQSHTRLGAVRELLLNRRLQCDTSMWPPPHLASANVSLAGK